jgi:chromosomal replication initiator protein
VAKEVTTHDRDVVSALRAALADRLGQKRFDLWFGQSTRLEFDDRGLAVTGPERLLVDWIRANFRTHIETACHDVMGQCPSIRYIVNPSLNDQGAEPAARWAGDGASVGDGACVQQSDAEPESAVSTLPMTLASAAMPVKGALPSAAPAAAKGASDPAPRRRFADLGSFVVGQANRLALTSAEMVARRTSHLSPLLLHGPTGVGKSHLLEGIWQIARRGPHRRTAVYLTAEQFTTQFLEALRGSGLPNFRRKYRGVDLLLIDDLQFFVGKKSTQVELLHTIDTLMREGRQLVFAADRPPAELPELGRELTTRLQSGMVCRVEPPDEEARRGIVDHLARRMQLDLPPEVSAFVAAQVTSHARAISGALCRLQATSESLRRPVTMELAAAALSDLIQESSRMVRLPDIEKAVCDVFGLAPNALQADGKGQRVSHPRMLAMWLARKHTRAALSEIGQFFGRRSHSTVVSAQRRIEGWMTDGSAIRLAHRAMNVDEAVRQIERRLAAG